MTKFILAFVFLNCVFHLSNAQDTFSLNTQAGIFHPTENLGHMTMQAWDNIPSFQGYKYILLQLKNLPDEKLHNTIRQKQIELLTYLPKHTYYVRVPATFDEQRFLKLGALSVFAPQAEHKLHLTIKNNIVPAYAMQEHKYKMMITLHPGIIAEDLNDLLIQSGASILNSYNHQHIAVSILPSKINELANLAAIQFINFIDAPLEKENIANKTDHRSNVLNSDYGAGRHYDGNGVRVALTDDGFIGPHIDYQGRTIQSAVLTVNTGDHGDHCAGTIMGAGNKDPLARGMAPACQLWVYDALATTNYILNDSLYTSPNLSLDIISTSYSNGCNTGYNSGAESADRQIRTYKNIMRVFSAGNDGTTNCGYGAGAGWGNITGGIKLAKNLIAVANLDYKDVLASSSSRGPASDGRIKPDVSGVGTNVYSTIDPHDYALKSGTSMSCPGVAGLYAQLYQAYRTLHSGQDPNGGLLKNVLMNTCDDIGNPGPDFKHGYGRVNGLRAVKVLESNQHTYDSVTTGVTKTKTLTIPANTHRVKIMLNWLDKEAAVASTMALVNDLDLKVTDPSANIFLPWVLNHAPNATTLNANAQRLIDHLNNAEQVTIDSPAAGNYSIDVSGFAVPFGPQDYFISYEFIPFDTVELTYPIGGEAFKPGEVQTLRWNSISNGSTYKLDYTTDNGASWSTIINAVLGTQNYYDWTIPNTLGGQCKVRITRGTYVTESPSNFSIANIPASLAITRVCPDTITLKWSPTIGATSYDVFMLGNLYMDSIGNTTDTFFHVANLNPNDEHWFSVRSVNNTNSSFGRRAIAIQQQPGLINCILGTNAEMLSVENPGNTALLTCALSNTVTVTLTVKNSGINPISNFPVSYQLDNGAIITETFAGSIPSGGQASYTFAAGLMAPSFPGNYILHAWTSLSGDIFSGDDSLHNNLLIVTSSTSNLPWSEDFETTTLCTAVNTCDTDPCALQNGLNNEPNGITDDFDWKAFQGPTATSATGPDVDHTLGNAIGNYVYIESSDCFQKSALLLTPCFTFTPLANPYLSYWYHLFGNGQGSLSLDAFVDGEWQMDITPSVNGDLGNTWLQKTINLSAYAGKTVFFRFRGKTGINQRSDMALDDLLLMDSVSTPPAGLVNYEQTFSVFPNPANQFIEIKSNGSVKQFNTIILYNTLGQIVYKKELEKTLNSLQVNTAELAKGMYHLVIKKDHEVLYRSKLVKE